MFQAHIRPAIPHIENQTCHHYIHCMIDTDTQTIKLKLTYKQAALLSHAIVEFQNSFHQSSHEDIMISEDDIYQLANLVKQVLDETQIEVFTDVTPHAFSSDEEIESYAAAA